MPGTNLSTQALSVPIGPSHKRSAAELCASSLQFQQRNLTTEPFPPAKAIPPPPRPLGAVAPLSVSDSTPSVHALPTAAPVPSSAQTASYIKPKCPKFSSQFQPPRTSSRFPPSPNAAPGKQIAQSVPKSVLPRIKPLVEAMPKVHIQCQGTKSFSYLNGNLLYVGSQFLKLCHTFHFTPLSHTTFYCMLVQRCKGFRYLH